MSYKTVLAHCNDKERLSRLLGVAAPLAAAFGGRLVGVSVIPPITVIPAGVPGAPNAIVMTLVPMEHMLRRSHERQAAGPPWTTPLDTIGYIPYP